MKKILALLFTFSFLAFAQQKPPSETTEEIDQSTIDFLDQSEIKKLTRADISDKWKTTLETSKSKKQTHEKVYTRGKDTILKIAWSDKISPTLKNYSSIKLTHKGIHIVEIVNFNGTTAITPSNKNPKYNVVTHIENQSVSVLIMGPNDWFENIILNGKNSTLIDDLKYTKQSAYLGKFKKYMNGALPKK